MPHQFISNTIINITAPTNSIILGDTFKTAWDDRKFLVFRNGYLLSKQIYNFIIPSPYNNYKEKVFYSTITFQPGDRIEIFYIENEQNFANVPFNRESRIASYIYYARSRDQRLIKIPYPNSSYRRSKDSFILFNDDGRHLDIRYDYTVSADGRFVTLADHEVLKERMLNFVVFTFCYTENRSINEQEEEVDPMDDDTTNLESINYTYSYSIENVTNTPGLVKFTPPFTGWANMIKENFILFGNSVFIDPVRYEVVSNDSIQFVDPEDAKVAQYRRYTMCIPVTNNKPENTAQNEFRYQVVSFKATQAMQSEFIIDVPDDSMRWYPFLVFRGSRLMDVDEEYVYDDTINTLTITDPSCYIKKGRLLTLVFLNKTYTDIEKQIHYIKMQFDVDPSGITEIPKYLYKNPAFVFDETNLLVFINGVFLEPERWSVTADHKIKLHPIEEKSYEVPLIDKTFTAIYIRSQVDPDNSKKKFDGGYGQKEIDPSEDNDKLRFDELYSYVKRK